jgi:hypothetical protein
VAKPAKPQPKIICKQEFATGSRIKKVKVHWPGNEAGMDRDTKLRRELVKTGDMRRPGEFGGGLSSGSGIGN